MKKILCVMMLLCATASGAFGSVAITAENFPDQAFRTYISSTFDRDSDRELSSTEIASAESMDIHSKGITDLTGVKHFTSLRILYCANNSLSNLDVSGCTSLYILSCPGNSLTSLNVTGCTGLERIYCWGNSLESLNVSTCTALTGLYCYENKLSGLDVSSNRALMFLRCQSNSISVLNLRNNAALKKLYCAANGMSALDLSGNPALQELNCSHNYLKTLDLSRNTALTGTILSGQNISGLNSHARGDGTYYVDLVNDCGLSYANLSRIISSSVKGYNTKSANVLTGYDDASGVASFSEEPVRFCYDYDTGSEHVMSVAFNAFPKITMTELVSGYANRKYDCSLEASGTGSLRWSIDDETKLPDGLNFYGTLGKISGTPKAEGKYTFTLTVSNTLGSDSKTFTLEILSPSSSSESPIITTTNADIPTGYVNASYRFDMQASLKSGITWSIDEGEVPGLTLSSSGRLSGKPSQSGSFDITVSVTDRYGGTDSQNFTVSVLPSSEIEGGPVILTTQADLPSAYEKTKYRFEFKASGQYSSVWSIVSGDIPGLGLSSAGSLTGTPERTGEFPFTVQAMMRQTGGTDTKNFVLTVKAVAETPETPAPSNPRTPEQSGGDSGGGGCDASAGGMFAAAVCLPGLLVKRRKRQAVMLVVYLAVMGGVPAVAANYWEEGNDGNSWETAYVIDSAEDFMLMRQRLSPWSPEAGKYYKIEADLDISEEMFTEYSPLYGAICLYGYLDGQNHTIRINHATDDDLLNTACLFDIVSADSVAIKNLNVAGNIRSNSQAAGIVYALSAGIIENCSFVGDIECGESAGGIVHSIGNMPGTEAIVRNCTYNGNIIVSGDDLSAGGIVGVILAGGSSIEGCTFSGNIVVSGDAFVNAGGIVALVSSGSSSSIRNCTVLPGTTIACSVQQMTSGAYIGNCGGIAGSANNASIINCTSEAVLKGNVIYKGGVLGSGISTLLSGNTWPDAYPQVGTDQPPIRTVSTDTLLSSHKYTVFDLPMTWTEAKAYCESLGGHLATITSQEEFDAVVSLLSADEDRPYWLGASDTEQEGSWKWVTGEDFTFTKWHTGEPNNQGGEEHYLILAKGSDDSWGWNDATNSHNGIDSSMWSFICEWEPVDADFAPMNSEYSRYIENPEAYFDGTEFYGDIPEPLDLSHLADNPPRGTVTPASAFKASSKHDPRNSGTLPQVRNQTPYGTCWSFASLGALETSYIAQGFGSTAPDTSELHQAWFVYKDSREGYSYPLNDPSKPTLEQGGNSSKSIAFLSRAGTASENDMPYSQAASIENNPPSKRPEEYSNPIRLKEAYNIGAVNANNREEIKSLIQKYGAVTFSYEHKKGELAGASYYYNTSKGYGHMVDAVGWDDDYSRTNFKNTPSSNGAWLIRNSWGTGSGDGGYFWMSYEQTIGDCAVFIAAKDSGLTHKGYDVLTQAGRNDFRWSANVFRADGKETIREIAFTTTDNNVSYDVYINKLGKTRPVNPGVPKEKAASGIMPYAGYHTIELSTSVDLESDDYFAVILKCEKGSAYDYTSAVEDPETVRAASVNAGESYFAKASSIPGDADWKDGATITDDGKGRPCNACIKAFTVPEGYVEPQPTPDTPAPQGDEGGGGSGGCMTGFGIAGMAAIAVLFLKSRILFTAPGVCFVKR